MTEAAVSAGSVQTRKTADIFSSAESSESGAGEFPAPGVGKTPSPDTI
jgi:hypothetical protein